jgi:hypothetical protein
VCVGVRWCWEVFKEGSASTRDAGTRRGTLRAREVLALALAFFRAMSFTADDALKIRRLI